MMLLGGYSPGPVTGVPQTRLLLISEIFPPKHGGSGRWLFELFRRLDGVEVTALAGRAPGDDEFDRAAPFRVDRFEAPIRSWGALHPRAGGDYWRAARQVKRLMSQRPPDVIHCGKCLPEGFVALAARGGPRVPVWCFAHGEELTLAGTSRELRWLTRFVLRRAARVIANSQHTKGLLVDRWRVPPDRVTVLTPGVDAARFTPAATDPELRSRLGWTGRRVILTVGALQKRKGQDMLIRALPAIRRDCPDVLYAIAGEGWERPYLEQLTRELGVTDTVSFVGTPGERELVQLYQQCDLFALPNRQVGWDFEGFGIVLLEAQACGRPVIAGRSGGTVETVLPGETGELVACESPEPLAAACAVLLGDPGRRSRMGERGRAWVVQHFDWPHLARRATDLFTGAA